MSRKVEGQMQAGIMLIEINNPARLNSLDFEMVKALTSLIKSAESLDDCKMIIIYGRGPGAFCAGGDMKEIYNNVISGNYDLAMDFFSKEYAMDLLIHRCIKPVIVIADGITMGGGMGIAQGADYVFITENTVMAMPETRIGFFPDVGATWWLNERLDGGMPLYMALTGSSLHGGQCIEAGLADFLVNSENTFELLFQLQQGVEDFEDDRIENIEVLKKYVKPLALRHEGDITEIQRTADRYFQYQGSLNDLFQSLEENSEDDIFDTLKSKSPHALRVTFELMAKGKVITLEEAFQQELRAGEQIIRHPDFQEGIRAQIIDRDKPKWHGETEQ